MSWFTMQAIYLVALNLCPLKSSKCLFKSKKFVYIGWMLPLTALIPFVSYLHQVDGINWFSHLLRRLSPSSPAVPASRSSYWLFLKIMINVQYRYKEGFHNKRDYCWLKPLNKFNTSISNLVFEEFSTDYTLLPVVIFNVVSMCLNLILFIIIIFQIYFNHWFKIPLQWYDTILLIVLRTHKKSFLNHKRLKETPNNKSSAVLWKLLKAMLYLIPLFNLTKLIGMMERQKYDYLFQLQCPNGKCCSSFFTKSLCRILRYFNSSCIK